MSLNIPVLLITWRRLGTTREVIAALREVKPKVIYVASDGARENNREEQLAVENVRKMIKNEIDWSCDLITRFSEINQGCRIGVSSAISWFFEHESMGIILEDDVLPMPDFFDFCRVNLHRYKIRSDIFAIGGFSALFTDKPYLSVNGSVWGWATWRDRWQKYEEVTPSIVEIKRLKKYCSSFSYFNWIKLINVMKSRHPIDTWDYWWLFTRIRHRGFIILPPRPLTLNIGFNSEGSTHTNSEDSRIYKINQRARILQESKFDIIEPLPCCKSKLIQKYDKLRLISRFGRVYLFKKMIYNVFYTIKIFFLCPK